jgi:hypothetical protein
LRKLRVDRSEKVQKNRAPERDYPSFINGNEVKEKDYSRNLKMSTKIYVRDQTIVRMKVHI